MEWLTALIVSVLKAFWPEIVGSMKDTAEEGAVDSRRKDRARKLIKKSRWTAEALKKTAPLLLILLLAGCSVRTVYVPFGTPVRLRETLEGVKVWALDKDGNPVKGEVTAHEGWFLMPIPPEEKDP